MTELLPALITAAFGVVLLGALVLVLERRLRRFGRAADTLRTGLDGGRDRLRAIAGSRHRVKDRPDPAERGVGAA